MIQSMTGYAAASVDTERGAMSLELRSVNARFLDLQFRVSDELRALEPMLREQIQARVSRGKVDCRLSLSAEAGLPAGAALDARALARLKELAAEAAKALPQAAPLRVADVLRWPGVIGQADLSEEALRQLAGCLLY